jgi:selenocysteine lyase/cysteine desulfurase
MDLSVVGDHLDVPLVTGGSVPYANLDYAASAPALRAVADAVSEFLPWYSSVHRGAGFTSMLSTHAYESARDAVHEFVGARPDDAVLFTRNTTDALNLMAHILPADAHTVVFETEHHANLLPWRRRHVTVLPPPRDPSHAVELVRDAVSSGRIALVAVTGASNVTGEIWPVADIAAVAHDRGARVLLDAAQLAPHRPLDITAMDVDYVALSGHKLYAPFGAGALVGRADWLASGEPYLAGGGAVEFVTADDVLWTGLPDRHEAGSPNVVGAVAMAAACRALADAGMDTLAAHEAELLRIGEELLGRVPGVELYRLWDGGHPRIGVLTFNLAGYDHPLLAAILSAEYGIGVRHGCFCAHPLVLELLHVDDAQADDIRDRLRRGEDVDLPGAVRASFGLGTTLDDIGRLATALERIATDGPSWTYERSDDDYVPSPDPRPWPAIDGLPVSPGPRTGRPRSCSHT